MTGAQYFRRALRYAKLWGVKVVMTDDLMTRKVHETAIKDEGNLSFSCSPLNPVCGIHVASGTVYWPEGRVGLSSNCHDGYALTHEVSHVLQREHPESVDEIESSMLALDYYGGKWLRMPGWGAWMEPYSLYATKAQTADSYCIWGGAPLGLRTKLIRESFELAVTEGLLTPAGRPTFQRNVGGNEKLLDATM